VTRASQVMPIQAPWNAGVDSVAGQASKAQRDGMPHRRGTVIITGGSGFLASRLAQVLAPRSRVILTGRQPPVTNVASVEWIQDPMEDLAGSAVRIAKAGATAVINCAAVTDPCVCANDHEVTEAINGKWPALLAQAMARESTSRLIHISTDAVFDGKNGNYTETDECRPVSAYGATKRQGEIGALSHLDQSLVVRTNFIGWHPKARGFVNSVVAAARGNVPFFGYTDYITSSMHIDVLCAALEHVAFSSVTGVLHIAALDAVSKADQAALLLDLLGASDAVLVRQPAPPRADRPSGPYNLSLNTELASSAVGLTLTSTKAALQIAASQARLALGDPHGQGV